MVTIHLPDHACILLHPWTVFKAALGAVWPLRHIRSVSAASLRCFLALTLALVPVQGRLWAGDADHLYPGASDQQLHWQHERECKRADGSCQLESVPG